MSVPKARGVIERLAALKKGGAEATTEWLKFNFTAPEVEKAVVEPGESISPAKQRSRVEYHIAMGCLTERGGYYVITIAGLRAHSPERRKEFKEPSRTLTRYEQRERNRNRERPAEV